jgi:transketolase
MSELFDCRKTFAQTLVDLAEKNDRIVAVVADSIGSSLLGDFKKRFPDRLINAGIAEQDMIGIAAGLSKNGWIPFVSSPASFLIGRALDQVKVDVAYSESNVKLVGMSPGMAYGALGATHHSIEDFAWTRVLPGLAVIAPADPVETAQAVTAAAERVGPIYVRVSRMGVPNVHPEGYKLRLGCAATLREGRDLTIVANGVTVHRAVAAAELLAGAGVSARVLNMATVSPIDAEAVEAAARETGAILTVEEASVRGGLGGAVAEVVVRTHPVHVRMLGVPGIFAPTGSEEWLLDHFGMSAEGIRDAAMQLLREKGQ